MEILGCFLFNGIWMLGTLLFAFLLCAVFWLVDLPAWLELGIIAVNSLFVGMLGMCFTISKLSRKSWKESRDEIMSLMQLGYPLWGASLIAVAIYFAVRGVLRDEVLQQWLCGGLAFGGYFLFSNALVTWLEKRNKK